VAGRSHSQLEGLIGFFINTVTLRIQVDSDVTFSEFLEAVKSNLQEVYAHQDLPFEKLVEEMQTDRNLQYTPIFQTMFSFQNVPASTSTLQGAILEPMSVDVEYSQYDLSMTIWENNGAYEGTVEYSRELFFEQTAQRIAKLYNTLLATLLQSQHMPVAKISLLTREEQKLLRIASQDNISLEAPENRCSIVERFQEQAKINPDRIAVSYLGQEIDYHELNRRASKLAERLAGHGIGINDIVAICADASVELIVGLLAILMAGSAYVPIEPSYPAERIQYILKDTKVSLLLTQDHLIGTFDDFNVTVWSLEQEKDTERSENCFKAVRSGYHDLACIIYTSGTTGMPKGVMLENAGIENLIQSFIDSYHPDYHDKLLPLTSVASASFIGEVFPILSVGGTLILTDKQILAYDNLMKTIRENDVTIISTVPSYIAKMNTQKIKTDKLRLILSGGETLLPSNIDNLVKTTTIVNGYGLTEATVCSTYQILNEDNYNDYAIVPIGKPIANTGIFLLDEGLNPVPTGFCGQIYISGVGLARGYLNDPELTVSRFISNPFIEGAKLYRSGDMAVRLEDESLRYIGRIDKQVKIRGYRIETEEIENHINAWEWVQNCYIMLREDNPGEKRLVAYIILAPNYTPSATLMRKRLLESLPAYMIPSAFVFVDMLPLNANLKIDPSQLPKPSYDDFGNSYVVPENQLEKTICAIWKEALGLEKVGITENFFDLGGHSLMLTQVYSKLSESGITNKEITIIDLFKYPTVKMLAEFISEGEHDDIHASVETRMEKRRAAFKKSAWLRNQ